MLGSRSNNHFQHAVAIAQHVVIPEAEHAIAFRREPSVAFGITRVLGVLPAIDFDDEALVMADKINRKTADRCLPPEA